MYLGVAIVVDQNISSCQISMNNLFSFQMSHTRARISERNTGLTIYYLQNIRQIGITKNNI